MLFDTVMGFIRGRIWQTATGFHVGWPPRGWRSSKDDINVKFQQRETSLKLRVSENVSKRIRRRHKLDRTYTDDNYRTHSRDLFALCHEHSVATHARVSLDTQNFMRASQSRFIHDDDGKIPKKRFHTLSQLTVSTPLRGSSAFFLCYT